MIALDTNVLVRIFVNDEPGQARRARAAISRAKDSNEPILINDVVLAETLWTLGRSYKSGRQELISTAEALFETPAFVFESRATVARAIGLFKSSSADFSDCLIVAKNEALGCRVTLTFDRDAATLPAAQTP